MTLRLLIAVNEDERWAGMLHEMLRAALNLVELDVEVREVFSYPVLLEHIYKSWDDVLMLDWEVAREETANLVSRIMEINPAMRVIALLPLHLRQYRQRLWEAGACTSIPREHLDPEWLSSALCLIYRAVCREADILAASDLESAHQKLSP